MILIGCNNNVKLFNFKKNKIMETSTLSQKIEELKQSGYTINYSVKDDKIMNIDTNSELKLDDLQIDHFFRFEGMTNPSDTSILYAINTKNNEKGTLVEAYGVNSSISKALAEKIK